MSRVACWKKRLDDILKVKTPDKFKWGENDCLQFVFLVDRTISANPRFTDVSEYLIYSSESEAVDLMNDWGMDDVNQIMDARLERKETNFLQVGDVGLIKYRTKNVLSVCVGSKFAHPWTTGLGYTDRSKVSYGWSL